MSWPIQTTSLVNIDMTDFNFKPFFQTLLQSWRLSFLQIPFWPNSPMPQACLINIMTLFFHRNFELIKSSKVFKQNWNDIATLLFLKFTTHDETYLRRLLEGPLHMEITLILDLHAISLNKICNKHSIYNCYLGIYK